MDATTLVPLQQSDATQLVFNNEIDYVCVIPSSLYIAIHVQGGACTVSVVDDMEGSTEGESATGFFAGGIVSFRTSGCASGDTLRVGPSPKFIRFDASCTSGTEFTSTLFSSGSTSGRRLSEDYSDCDNTTHTYVTVDNYQVGDPSALSEGTAERPLYVYAPGSYTGGLPWQKGYAKIGTYKLLKETVGTHPNFVSAIITQDSNGAVMFNGAYVYTHSGDPSSLPLAIDAVWPIVRHDGSTSAFACGVASPPPPPWTPPPSTPPLQPPPSPLLPPPSPPPCVQQDSNPSNTPIRSPVTQPFFLTPGVSCAFCSQEPTSFAAAFAAAVAVSPPPPRPPPCVQQDSNPANTPPPPFGLPLLSRSFLPLAFPVRFALRSPPPSPPPLPPPSPPPTPPPKLPPLSPTVPDCTDQTTQFACDALPVGAYKHWTRTNNENETPQPNMQSFAKSTTSVGVSCDPQTCLDIDDCYEKCTEHREDTTHGEPGCVGIFVAPSHPMLYCQFFGYSPNQDDPPGQNGWTQYHPEYVFLSEPFHFLKPAPP